MKQTWINGIGITLKNKDLGEILINQRGPNISFFYPCSDNYTCTPYILTLPPGTYFFRIVGASGGYAISSNGLKINSGYGGVSEGVYKANYSQRVFLFIGGSGEIYISGDDKMGGYNGGGNSFGQAGGGGGSTDIRFNEDLSIDSRIIVAGGGDGGRFHGHRGGNGGGYNGEQGEFFGSDAPCYGSANGCIGSSGVRVSSGSKGKGADCIAWGAGYGGGGGGSGYYGGGCAGNTGGSGGSGFIGDLISLDNYQACSYISEHEGNGFATISIIQSSYMAPYCTISRNIFGAIYNLIFVISLMSK